MAAVLPKKHPPRHGAPSVGDRILLFQDVETLQQVLRREKTMEVRHLPCAPGGAWLGVQGQIHAWGNFGASFAVNNVEELRDYEGEHRVAVERLPYKQTHLWPLTEMQPLTRPVAFRRVPGPTTWVGFSPVEEAPEDVQHGGLVNVGNSCFINAALQALYSVTTWRRMLRQSQNAVAADLLLLWHRLRASAAVKPETVLERWYHGAQEDSAEFFRVVSEQAGLIAGTAGLEQYELRCRDCGEACLQGAATFMSDLQMQLPTGVRDLQGVVDRYFRAAVAPDGLEYQGSAWQCPACQSNRLPWRKLRVRRAPAVLLAAVKRWRVEIVDGLFVQHKDTTPLTVPELIDVQGHVYQVVATVHHVGAEAEAGHYYAAVRGSEGDWHVYDDAGVASMPREQLEDEGSLLAMEGQVYYAVLETVATQAAADVSSLGQEAARCSATQLESSVADAGPTPGKAQAIEASNAIADAATQPGTMSVDAGPAPGEAQAMEASSATADAATRTPGAMSVDGLLPPVVNPLQCLSAEKGSPVQDAHQAFEEDVVGFLNAVSAVSVAQALRDIPERSTFVDQLTFRQCLVRLQAGLRAVRAGSLTAAEEVDVFTPLWWIADYRLAVYMEAFARVVALSSTMLLETFKAFASSLLHRKVCVEWSDYTLSHRYWAQVVTDIGTGKSPVMKTVREAFKRASASWQQ